MVHFSTNLAREITHVSYLVEVVEEVVGKKNYYVLRDEIWEDDDGVRTATTNAYTMLGDYIGAPDKAHDLCDELLILPRPVHDKDVGSGKICQIGYCDIAQRWYAWGKHGIDSFCVGTKVKMGHPSFVARDLEEFIEQINTHYSEIAGEELVTVKDEVDGTEGVLTSSRDLQDGDHPQELFTPLPDVWGRGEWTAETTEEAKKMAQDFALNTQ